MDRWKSIISGAIIIIGALLAVFQTENAKVNKDVTGWESAFRTQITRTDRHATENYYQIKNIDDRLTRIENHFYADKLKAR